MLKKKWYHFWSAVSNSVLPIVVCIVLVAIFIVLYYLKLYLVDNVTYREIYDSFLAIISGIVTGVITTTIYRIFDKYSKSIDTVNNVKHSVTILLNKCGSDFLNVKAYKESLLDIKSQFSLLSYSLTYKKDFFDLMECFDNLITISNNANESENGEQIKNEIGKIANIRDRMLWS